MNPPSRTTHYREAVQSWLDPKQAKLRDAYRAKYAGTGPSPAEELILRGILDTVSIPTSEWGAICALADSKRQGAAITAVQGEALDQLDGAERFLDLEADDFLHWPWRAMDELVGGMAPGTLHFVACPSKGGKTTLCRSAARQWIGHGRRVYYAGFEMPAKMLRTMYAADDIGIDPGDVVSGKWLGYENYHVLRDRMAAAYREQRAEDSPYRNLRFSSVGEVSKRDVEGMMERAADWGAQAFILDHLDHLDSSQGSDYGGVQGIMHALNRLADKYAMTVIGTSQMNTTGKTNDLWRDHRPLRLEHVKYGSLKLEVCTTMVGLYRPVKVGLTKEERQIVESGRATVYSMLERGVNAMNLMASRTYGSRIGQQGLLGWDRGTIVDLPAHVAVDIEARKHAIKTGGYL